eukprot:CAMPEP_0182914054 /NCGR_PEP_ID=MMETSP0034_2-20130328/38355_1 /TAXON_ID=156128 /ORGANISM="Nephroselmis pyriformis, Strain CCMP717" /LENGTH=720 /DNA_ID=CAMNT_0025050787 /DNA_START=56 /DNA_END=2214 /DNA_ORIENTATION=+
MSKPTECVKVVVRCRPLFGKEINENRQRIVEMDTKSGVIMIKNPKADKSDAPKQFTFDQVYDWNTIQLDLYNTSAKPIVDSVMSGYNGTIFAYGQTGTGKTHTMEGKLEPPEERGIVPNCFDHIFKDIESISDRDFLVRASFLEIYNEDVRDLLSKNPNNKLDLKENVDSGVFVKDLTLFVVKGVHEINNVLQVGKKNRTVGSTLMNQDSSRSHSIFTVTVETSDRGSDGHIRVGKLNLVDLAGSERQAKTGATGERLTEATKINLSLSALGNVISSLVDGKSSHIPYRDSKLTRLLQDSLGGNTKTVMIANIGPADYNFDETMSTLRYANRAKNIKNKPRVNEDPKDAMLREFQNEIARLKSQLDGSGGGGGGGGKRRVEKVVQKEKDLTETELDKIRQQARLEMEAELGKSVDNETAIKARKKAEREARKKYEAMLEEKTRTEEERQRIAEAMKAQDRELQKHSGQLAKEREQADEWRKKLEAMAGSVLQGTGEESLVEKSERIEAEMKEQEEELERKRQEEAEKQRRIAELEEMQLIAEEQYTSVQDEIEMKTKKLKKLHGNYKRVGSELKEIEEEFQREREDLLDTIRSLTQQIKLKDLVASSFIPPEEQHKIVQRAHWDEANEAWIIERIQYAGNNVKSKQAKPEHKRTNNVVSQYMSNVYGFDEDGMQAMIEDQPGMVMQGDEESPLANVYFTYSEEAAYGGEPAAAAESAKPA